MVFDLTSEHSGEIMKGIEDEVKKSHFEKMGRYFGTVLQDLIIMTERTTN